MSEDAEAGTLPLPQETPDNEPVFELPKSREEYEERVRQERIAERQKTIDIFKLTLTHYVANPLTPVAILETAQKAFQADPINKEKIAGFVRMAYKGYLGAEDAIKKIQRIDANTPVVLEDQHEVFDISSSERLVDKKVYPNEPSRAPTPEQETPEQKVKKDGAAAGMNTVIEAMNRALTHFALLDFPIERLNAQKLEVMRRALNEGHGTLKNFGDAARTGKFTFEMNSAAGREVVKLPEPQKSTENKPS